MKAPFESGSGDALTAVGEFCRTHRLFEGGTVLVALSGGGDSVCLVTMLLSLAETFGLTIMAAHLNHALRGEASDRDESFCRRFCRERDIPLVVKRLEPGNLVRPGISLETAARDARREFLLATADETGASRIATGHTLSDQAETILQRIIRGTGPAGLAGIPPIRDGLWVRPLLILDRDAVRDWLDERHLPHVEDETNDDRRFFRNHIRHRLLPLLREEFSPGIDRALARLAELSGVQEAWIGEQVGDAFDRCRIHADSYKILLEKALFVGYHTLLQQRVIRHCLNALEGAGRDDDFQEIELIREHIRRDRSRHAVTGAITVETNEHIIIFSRSLKRYGPIPIEVPGTTTLPYDTGALTARVHTPADYSGGNRSVLIPRELIARYGPLTVGSVMTGETIALGHRSAHCRIRDLYSTARIPATLRNGTPVVRVGAVPVWIPGLTVSDTVRTLKTAPRPHDSAIVLEYRGGIDWQM